MMPPRSSRSTSITIENGVASADERSCQPLQRTRDGQRLGPAMSVVAVTAAAVFRNTTPSKRWPKLSMFHLARLRRWIANGDLVVHRVAWRRPDR